MKTISMISFRNLARQKRRNFLLGMGMGFGMCILVVANSFSSGLIDVLINDLISRVAGHVQINAYEKNRGVFRDRERVEEILGKYKEIIIKSEESIGAYVKIVGKGKSLSAPIIGVKNKEGFFGEYLQIIEGSVEDFENDVYEYPVVLSPDKAKGLNVEVGDKLKARFTTLSGQVQAVNLQVIAIATTNSSFMDYVLYIDLDKIRKLLGYNKWESGPIQLTIKEPRKNAKELADSIQKELEPRILNLIGRTGNNNVNILAYNNDSISKELLFAELDVTEGITSEYMGKEGFIISEDLSRELNLSINDKIVINFKSKYNGEINKEFKISGFFKGKSIFPDNLIFINAEYIYKFFNENNLILIENDSVLKKQSYYDAIAKEYKLLDRAKDSDENQSIARKERAEKSNRARYSVRTMFETASQILSIEFALTAIAWTAGMILFFIILIGVVNTLRMTIKERTREIGTLRAMGMQAKDVRNIFVMESIFLSIISCTIGAMLAYVIIKIVGKIEFDINNPLSFILKDKRIYFKFELIDVLVQGLILVSITALTAYFPSRKASKIKPGEALRHV